MLEEFSFGIQSLSKSESAMTIFPGYESRLRECLEKKRDEENSYISDSGSHTKVTALPLDECRDRLSLPVKDSVGTASSSESTVTKRRGRKGFGGFLSEAGRTRAGKNAELAVLNTLAAASDRFCNVVGCSRNLNPTAGDDFLGYDLTYSRVGKDGKPGSLRMLEVKASRDGSIIMSENEYRVALENADNYDIAIVNNGRIRLIQAPFSRLTITPAVHSYSMTFTPEAD